MDLRKELIEFCSRLILENKQIGSMKHNVELVDNHLKYLESTNNGEEDENFRVYDKCVICGYKLPDNYLTNVCYGCD